MLWGVGMIKWSRAEKALRNKQALSERQIVHDDSK